MMAMKPRLYWVLAVLLAGCGPNLVAAPPQDGGGGDVGAPPTDVVTAEDVAVATDAGEPSVDAGAQHSGQPAEDAGLVDSGSPTVDVGAPPADVGSPAVDAGLPPPADAGALPDPSRAGPWRVAATTGPLTGSSGNARIFVPMGAPSGTRFPLVVFAHGFQLAVNNYDGLLTHVASHGYVVASVDYPGSLLRVDHRDVPRVMIAVRAAFAQVPAYAALVDPMRAAAMGHSLGGKGAIMAALDAPGAFNAVVALDPVDDNPAPGGRPSESAPSIAPERMGSLRVPLTLVGATQSRCGFQACAPEESNYQRFAAAAPSALPLSVYALNNFGHNDFVDTACGIPCALCARGAAPLDSRAAALRAAVVATLGRHLRGEVGYQSWLDGAARRALLESGALWDGMAATLPACR
jgi:pimeloyl-ACP methyl ester carboxylesterase